MSKKMIILIEIVICTMAIILISIFGNNPEMWRDFEYVSTIQFSVSSVELDQSQNTYQLVWTVGPENATIKKVNFTSNNDNVIIDQDTGLVTFTRKEGVTITATSTDGSNVRTHIDITFKAPGGGVIILD